MTLPSTWTADRAPSVSETLPPLPTAARARLDVMLGAMEETNPGRYSISRSAAPTAEERRGLSERRRTIAAALERGDRTAIEDRLHGFAYGFTSLRSLDATTFAGTLRAFVQAVDDMPYEAVARACLAWTKAQFPWANCRFPPDAPELARAAKEMRCGLLMEDRELRLVLEAKVGSDPALPIPQAQRDAAVSRWNEIRAGIERSNVMAERTPEEIAAERAEMARANDVVAARERAARDAGHRLRGVDNVQVRQDASGT